MKRRHRLIESEIRLARTPKSTRTTQQFSVINNGFLSLSLFLFWDCVCLSRWMTDFTSQKLPFSWSRNKKNRRLIHAIPLRKIEFDFDNRFVSLRIKDESIDFIFPLLLPLTGCNVSSFFSGINLIPRLCRWQPKKEKEFALDPLELKLSAMQMFATFYLFGHVTRMNRTNVWSTILRIVDLSFSLRSFFHAEKKIINLCSSFSDHLTYIVQTNPDDKGQWQTPEEEGREKTIGELTNVWLSTDRVCRRPSVVGDLARS